MRGNVQHWSAHPHTAGPASSTVCSSSSWAGLSLQRAPPGPLEANAGHRQSARGATGWPTSGSRGREALGQPFAAVIESMNGARFMHDQLELRGWAVDIADAVKVKGFTPLACKTDKIDAW